MKKSLNQNKESLIMSQYDKINRQDLGVGAKAFQE